MSKVPPLFIHVPKTGGMSVHHGLGRLIRETLSRDKLKSLDYAATIEQHMRSKGEPTPGYRHARWRDVKPGWRDKGRCFTVLRNPWSRVVSRYRFGLNTWATRPYNYTNFEEFLAEHEEWGQEPYYWHRAVRGWYPAVDHVTDGQGNLKCDVLRTEHLDDDIWAYFGKRLPPRRRNVTRGDAVDYKTFYDDRTIQLVADWYAEDIEMFGFDFDTPATKNLWEGLGA